MVTCPHLSGGCCQIATTILGRPVTAHEPNCLKCGGQATVDAPHPEVINLIRHQALVDNDQETIVKLRRHATRIVSPPVPADRLPDGLLTPEQIAKRTEAELIEMRGSVSLYPCVHRGEETRTAECQTCSLKGRLVQVYRCNHFGRECTGPGSGIRDAKDGQFLPSCWACVAPARKPPGFDLAAHLAARCQYLKHPAAWAGRYQGGHLFLICGGPSLANVDWSKLPRRGPLTMAVNNAGAGPSIPFRPDLWIAADTPGRFAPEIWHDPGITKFTGAGFKSHPIQERTADGWRESKLTVGDMPNVELFKRSREAFDAATYLTSPYMQFGREALNNVGQKHLVNRSTMLFTLRLAIDLGFRTINLVGVDFAMDEAGQQYAWPENPKAARARNNAALFRFLNLAFKSLRPALKQAGVQVWNVTPGSRLTAFDQRDFATACAEAETPASSTLVGLYDYSRQKPKPDANPDTKATKTARRKFPGKSQNKP